MLRIKQPRTKRSNDSMDDRSRQMVGIRDGGGGCGTTNKVERTLFLSTTSSQGTRSCRRSNNNKTVILWRIFLLLGAASCCSILLFHRLSLQSRISTTTTTTTTTTTITKSQSSVRHPSVIVPNKNQTNNNKQNNHHHQQQQQQPSSLMTTKPTVDTTKNHSATSRIKADTLVTNQNGSYDGGSNDDDNNSVDDNESNNNDDGINDDDNINNDNEENGLVDEIIKKDATVTNERAGTTTTTTTTATNGILCGRTVPHISSITDDELKQHILSSHSKKKKKKSLDHIERKNETVIVLGAKANGKGYGQMNNHLNAIFHAQDYVRDIGATLAFTRTGWAVKVLQKLFFSPTNYYYEQEEDQNNTSSLNPTTIWESIIEYVLGVSIIDENDYPPSSNVYYNRSKEVYWYHTQDPAISVEQRRKKVLRDLWSHPNHHKKYNDDGMCSSVLSMVNSDDEKYVVIHLRDMKDGKEKKENECFPRLSNFGRRTGVEPKATCTMPAEYIKSILRPIGMMNQKIIIISNGKLKHYLSSIRKDKELGPHIHTVPPSNSNSSPGSDMMLAILADVFIGAPISTFAGNIARARIALGFDPSTNYLFMKKNDSYNPNITHTISTSKINEEKNFIPNEKWIPFCNSTCLFDVVMMRSYVG